MNKIQDQIPFRRLESHKYIKQEIISDVKINFDYEFWILDQLTNLRRDIPKFIIKQLTNININIDKNNISRYMKRAFTRNIFNIVKNGKNPFIDDLIYTDFIIDSDLKEILFDEHIKLLDFTWLIDDLSRIKRIRTTFNTRIGNYGSKSIKLVQLASPIYNDDVIKASYSNNSNTSIDKKKIRQEFGNDAIYFSVNDNKLIPDTNQSSKFIQLINGDRTVIISRVQYNRAYKLFFHTRKVQRDLIFFHNILFLVAYRYVKIGCTNQHCSIPPNVLLFTKSKMELFGSPLNTSLIQYCSPFHDIERYFGSCGTFFNYNLAPGVYNLDPPYDYNVMKDAMLKVVHCLNTIKDITFICCIPVWDKTSQIEKGFFIHHADKFEPLDIAKDSGYLKSHDILDKNEYPFYNFYLDIYIAVSNTHLLILSNDNNYQLSIQDIKDKWKTVTTNNSQTDDCSDK